MKKYKQHNLKIIIPTYWCPPSVSRPLDNKVFDHPTPIDKEGTLSDAVRSLDVLDNKKFELILVVATTDQKIDIAASNKVRSLLKSLRPGFMVRTIDKKFIDRIKKKLQAKKVPEKALALLNLDNYASIRNICLLSGIMGDSDISVFLDDDEVLEDSAFLEKIISDFSDKDNKIDALAGFYLQPDGGYFLNPQKVPEWKKESWNNLAAMNQAFSSIISKPPAIKHTPFVFGGNMALRKEVMMKIPFDPMITRGEDIDYLINCRISGIPFWLDNRLAIKHLPPPKASPEWQSFREDIKRFLYERKKVSDHKNIDGVSVRDLMPYPGTFLGKDLEDRIIEANAKLQARYEKDGDERGIKECDKNKEIISDTTLNTIDTKVWLSGLIHDWQLLTGSLDGHSLDEF